MTKATVTRLFIGSLIAFGAGAIVAIMAIGLAIANDVFVMDGNDIVGDPRRHARVGPDRAHRRGRPRGRWRGRSPASSLGSVPLLNTWQLESKAWFVALLLLGIFNFGFLAMIAYLIAGPDGRATPAVRVAPAPA